MTTEKVSLKHWLETRWRGTLMAVIIGAASLFVSEHYGGPAVLFALLIGMAFHFSQRTGERLPVFIFAPQPFSDGA